jgi:hypothetical protein
LGYNEDLDALLVIVQVIQEYQLSPTQSHECISQKVGYYPGGAQKIKQPTQNRERAIKSEESPFHPRRQNCHRQKPFKSPFSS